MKYLKLYYANAFKHVKLAANKILSDLSSEHALVLNLKRCLGDFKKLTEPAKN